MHVAFAIDKSYMMPLVAALTSLVANADESRKIVVHILHTGLNDNDKKAILGRSSKKNVEVNIVDLEQQTFLRGMPVSGHISLASYYRLALPSMVPQDVDKLIYLDADVIVNTDIGRLWDIDIGDKPLLAVQEQGADYFLVSSKFAMKWKELGMDPSSKMFNAGVLVINLRKWREDGIADKVVKYVGSNREFIRMHDQDGLNGVLEGKWGELDFRWNLVSHAFTNPSWDDGPVKDRDTYVELTERPYIVHFTTDVKPWQDRCQHPHKGLFMKCLRMVSSNSQTDIKK